MLRGHEDSVSSAVFSPDGSRIATASGDNTARLWDAASGKEIAVLRGHVHDVSSAVFSPDGSRIATASHDGTARLWDVSRTNGYACKPAIVLAAALACGVGRRTDSEAADFLMQDAPQDLFAEAMRKLVGREAEVEAAARLLRAPLHPNCYLSPTQFAELFPDK